MSHLKERKEKNCLNCNAQVYGRFCHICGQENIEPKETAWHLIVHFFNDITHFDGKFFGTLKLLMTRPGFLSGEYMAGKRMSYLNPIRMYIFTSAFFFLIFFSVTHFDTRDVEKKKTLSKLLTELRVKESTIIERSHDMQDTALSRRLQERLADIRNDMAILQKDSSKKTELIAKADNDGFSMLTGGYKTVKQYDSVQNKLPENKKDSWLETTLMHRVLTIKERYREDVSIANVLIGKFFHNFPQILFISLPLFGLLLKLLYVRRKRFFYVDHAIFSVHFYIFSFITLLILIGVTESKKLLHISGWSDAIDMIICLGILFYLYKAMRNFYQQRRGKTILKFMLLCLMTLFVFLFLFALFFIFSFFQI